VAEPSRPLHYRQGQKRNNMLNKFPRTLMALAAALVAAVGCSDDDVTSNDGPSAVTNLVVTASRDTVYATWTPSADATGHEAVLTAGALTVATENGDESMDEAVFGGLTSGTTYSVRVRAIAAGGTTAAAPADVMVAYCDGADQADPELTLRFESSILWDNVAASAGDPDANFTDASGDGYDLDENKEFFEYGFNNMVANPNLTAAAFDVGTMASPPNMIPTSMPMGYTAFDASTLNGADGLVMPTDGRVLQDTDYAGAVAPGTSLNDAWYTGWTVWATDGSDSRDCGILPVVAVNDSILADVTWTNDNCYRLEGPIFVGRDVGIDGTGGLGVTLTIEPGTTVVGELAGNLPQGTRGSYLVISRGSKIIADAYRGATPAAKPDPDSVIVFTSNAPKGSRARGDWGGIVINGRAPTNAGDEASGEGESGLYGGTDINDDSGILRGVRVEFAGDAVTATDELNGIAFQGVGAGTTVDYVQVHYNQDDGTEPFGGTVSQTHIVVTGIADDSFDGTDGYRGFMQFLIAQQRADDADNGFEISNNGDDPGAVPQSMAVIANATMVGSGFGSGGIHGLGSSGDVGVLFREGSNYRLFNVIAVGFGDSGFDVEGAQTAANADCRIGK